ncbi:MAG: DUF4118 domain-containing protein [Kofleriaceae bacterium]
MPVLPPRSAWTYGSSVVVVAATTGVGLVAFPYVELADLAMLYLPAVMVAALAGRGPALVASTLAVLAFDVCFVPPRFTLVVDNPRHVVTFAVMFGTALAIATLAERGRRQAALTQQADVRARTEELRATLLSSVSHDLRTPLAVITAAASSAADPAVPATARAELLASVVAEARRLERMLSNLLQLTRVETGIVPVREWVPLDELCGAALARVEAATGDIAATVAVGDVAVPVDPVLFELVLVNLIENAVKHGAPPLELVAHADGARVRLEVGDRGAGLAAADHERVFEKFYRASAAPGAGLGLAVVRAIVTAHGGTTWARPRADGGTWFVVDLPAVPQPAALGPAPVEVAR